MTRSPQDAARKRLERERLLQEQRARQLAAEQMRRQAEMSRASNPYGVAGRSTNPYGSRNNNSGYYSMLAGANPRTDKYAIPGGGVQDLKQNPVYQTERALKAAANYLTNTQLKAKKNTADDLRAESESDKHAQALIDSLKGIDTKTLSDDGKKYVDTLLKGLEDTRKWYASNDRERAEQIGGTYKKQYDIDVEAAEELKRIARRKEAYKNLYGDVEEDTNALLNSYTGAEALQRVGADYDERRAEYDRRMRGFDDDAKNVLADAAYKKYYANFDANTNKSYYDMLAQANMDRPVSRTFEDEGEARKNAEAAGAAVEQFQRENGEQIARIKQDLRTLPAAEINRRYGSKEAAQKIIDDFDAQAEKLQAQAGKAQAALNKVAYQRDLDETYKDITSRADFDETSAKGAAMLPDANNELEAQLHSFINGDDAEKQRILDAIEHGANTPNADGISISDRMRTADAMNAVQKKIYNYIYATDGAEAALNYIDKLEPVLIRERAAEEEKEERLLAKQNPGLASVKSIMLSPWKGLDLVKNIGELIGGRDTDALGDRQTVEMTPAKIQRVIRDQVQKDITESATSEEMAKVANFLYGTGMSMGDNIANMVASGGNETGTLILMASGAAADTYADCLQRGYKKGSALSKAIVSGLIEYATEKIGLDNFFSMIEGGKTSAVQFIRNIAAQTLAEGGEEVLSDIGNEIYDALDYAITGNEGTDARIRINELMEQGLTEAQATGKWFGEFAAGMGESFLGGALSGAVMGAGGSAIGNVRYNVENSAQIKAAAQQIVGNIDAQNTIVQYGLQLEGDAAANARVLQQAIENGEKLTQAQIEEQLRLNDKAYRKASVEQEDEQRKQAKQYEKAAAQDAESQQALIDEAKKIGGAAAENAEALQRVLDEEGGLSRAQVRELIQANQTQIQAGTEAAADRVREMGVRGIPYENVINDELAAQYLSGDQIRQAYMDGLAEYNANGGNEAASLGRLNARTEAAEAQLRENTVENTTLFDGLAEARIGATGGAVQLTGIDSIQDGEIYFRTADGGFVSAEDLSSIGGVRTDNFARAVMNVYDGARAGLSFEQVTRGSFAASSFLTAGQARAAYNAGVQSLQGGYYGTEGENVPGRSGEWNDGERTGEQNGRVAGGTEEAQGGRSRNGETAAGARKGSEGAANVSARSLGINNGTDRAEARILTYDEVKKNKDLYKVYKRAAKDGVTVQFFEGSLYFDEGNGEFETRGVYENGKAWVRADHPKYTAEQIYRHEYAHHLKQTTKGFMAQLKAALEYLGDEQITDLANEYSKAFIGAVVVDENGNINKAARDYALEEMYCDSYAGMNGFDGKFGTDVQQAFAITASEEVSGIAEKARANETRGAPEGEAKLSPESKSNKESEKQANPYSLEELERTHPDGIERVKARELSSFKDIKYLSQKNLPAEALKQVKKNGHYKNRNDVVYVTFADNNKNARVTEKSFKHGDADTSPEYRLACMNLTKIAEKAVAINELNADSRHAYPSTVYMAVVDSKKSSFVVRIIVSNGTGEIEGLNVVYAVRKESLSIPPASAYAQTETQGDAAPAQLKEAETLKKASSKLTIREFLDIVKGTDLARASLSGDVLESLGETRYFEPKITPSLRFSIESPVEQVGDLVAVHNMTGDELVKSLDMGGLPMPSIAVIKAENGHYRYGDISLVFGKETIDPQFIRKNKVYGGDAWTPTYPTIEYKARAKNQKAISDKYYDIAKRIGYENAKPLYNYVYDLERQLDNNGGEAGLLSKLYEDTDLMNLYLQDTGKAKIEDVYNETRKEMSEADRAFSQAYIDALGEDTIREVKPPKNENPLAYRKAFINEHRAEIMDAYESILRGQLHFTDEEVKNVLDNVSDRDLMRHMRDAWHLLEEGGVTVSRQYDVDATHKAIRNATDQSAYRKWIDGMFKGVEEKSGIRNNADYYTPNGNRRSFEALHWENTLENVVKAMSQQEQTGNTSIFSGNAIWGVAAKEYKSIDEIRADRNRLTKMSEDEYSEIKQKYGDRFTEIAESIRDTRESNYFIGIDNAYENIVDAVRKFKTKEAMLNYLKKYNPKATMQTVNDVIELVRDIANMPTEYFEAKPMRAVGIDEIRQAIIPEGKYGGLKERLESAGVPVIEYEAGNEDARKAALNSEATKEVRFSIENVSPVDTAALEDENASLKRALTAAEAQLKKAKGAAITEKQYESWAKRILKEYSSKYKADELKDDLRMLFNYISAGVTEQSVADLNAYGIGVAKEILENSSTLDRTAYDDTAELRKYLRETPFSVSDADKAEIAAVYGSYGDWRKSMFGKLNIKNDAQSMDSMWQELVAGYGAGWFDADTTIPDMPVRLTEFFDAIAPRSAKYHEAYGYTADEAAIDLWLNMQEHFVGQTLGDAQAAEIRKQIQAMRAASKASFDARYKEIKMKWREDGTWRMLSQEREAAILRAIAANRKYENLRRSTQKRELKGKITRIANDLSSRLTHPTENRHVPKGMVQAVAELAKAIDMGNMPGSAVWQKMQALHDAYEALAKDEDFAVKSEYDQMLSQRIDDLRKDLQLKTKGKTLREMSVEELRSTYEILKAVQKQVRDEGKLIMKGKRIDAYQTAQRIIEEVKAAKGAAIHSFGNWYLSKTLDPRRQFRRMSGYAKNSQLEMLGKDLNDGQLRQTQIMMEGSQIFDPLFRNKEMRKAAERFQGKRAEWIDTGVKDSENRPVKLTPAMRVSLYLHSLNEDNMRHILNGGVCVPNAKEYARGNYATAFTSGTTYYLTEQNVKDIVAGMDDFEKEFARLSYDFFNGFCKRYINETSLALNGYKKANVKNYFPITVDKSYLEANFDVVSENGAIENMGGRLTERQSSGLPIYLEDAANVVDRQLNNVAAYAGLAVPMRNFKKAYSVRSMGYRGSVQKAINETWHEQGRLYIDNLMKDLAKARKQEGGRIFSVAKGAFAQATLAMNISVTMKQMASYPTAAAVLGWKPLMKALVKGGRKGMPISRADVNLIKKYSPLLWYRNQGYNNPELGDIVRDKGWAAKVPWLMGWINKTDAATVGRLWYAAEYYVQKHSPNLKVKSDEYYQEVARMFNKTVEETQPNYTTMQRPDVLRNPNAVVKGLTMFMTQRLQNAGILIDAVGEYRARFKDYRANKTEAAKADLKAAGANLARAVSSQLVAAAVIAAMTLLAKAVTHKMDPYRDEKKELTWESIMSQMGEDAVSTLIGSFLGGNEIYEIINKFTGRGYGNVIEVGYLATINDIIDTVEKIGKAGQDLLEAEGEAAQQSALETLLPKLEAGVMYIGQAVGIPFRNAKNLAKGLIQHGQDIAAGVKTGEYKPFATGAAQMTASESYAAMYDALMDGDIAAYNRYYQTAYDTQLEKLDETKYTDTAIEAEKKIAQGIVNELKDRNADIALAAGYMQQGEYRKATELYDKLEEQGFDREWIYGAVKKYLDSQKEKEPTNSTAYDATAYTKEMIIWTLERGAETGDYSDYDALFQAITEEKGSEDKALQYVKTTLGSEYKSAYIDAMSEEPEQVNAEETAQKIEKTYEAAGIGTKSLDTIKTKTVQEQMTESAASGDYAKISGWITTMREEGKEPNDISDNLRLTFRPIYMEAYAGGDMETCEEIEKYLLGLGLKTNTGKDVNFKKSIKGWQEKAG